MLPRWVAYIAVMLSISAAASAQNLERTERSVVLVVVPGKGGTGAGSGTGFAVTPRHVVTAFHVVEDAKWIAALAAKNASAKGLTARLIATDKSADLALLEVDGLEAVALPLAIGPLEKGQELISVGFPENANRLSEQSPSSVSAILDPTVSRGNVAKLEIQLAGTPDEHLVVGHYAPTAPGNSGGPILDSCFRVVAVTRSGKAASAGSGGATLYLASHIGATHRMLQQAGIDHATESSVCQSRAASPESHLAGTNAAPLWLWIAALCIGLIALVLSLRRPRERIVRVIEEVSRRVKVDGRRLFAKPERGQCDGALLVLSGFTGSCSSAVRISVDLPPVGQLGRDELREFVIGRSAALSHAVVDDPTVSRRHARLTADGKGRPQIEDLNSAKGTSVNGSALLPFEPIPLHPGDSLKLGGVALQVLAGAALRTA